MYKYSLTRPRANIKRIHLWHSLEELAPHDALFWWGALRYQIIFNFKKKPLTLQGYAYEETYTELEDYVCPVTNIKNLPPFSRQEECKCRTPLDFDLNQKGQASFSTLETTKEALGLVRKLVKYIYIIHGKQGVYTLIVKGQFTYYQVPMWYVFAF
jgi:hypothetical protein